MSGKIPYIYGEYHLKGTASPGGNRGNSNILYQDNYISIYANNCEKFIQGYAYDKTIYFFHGRIYSPYLIPDVRRRIDKIVEIEDNPGRADGSFFIIKIDLRNPIPTLKITNNKFGSRLILYVSLRDRVLFSTHLEGIKTLLRQDAAFHINQDVLFYYYFFGHTPQNMTLIDGLSKITAGTSLSVNGCNVRLNRYFEILDWFEFNPEKKDEGFYAQEIDHILSRTIEKRLIHSDAFACAISGGVDSGYIASKMLQQNREVVGYNLSYENYYNEYGRLDEFAKENGIKLKKVILEIEEFLSRIPECNASSSEPVGFNDVAMHYLFRKMVSDGFNEILDGDGADRLFFGMVRQLQYARVFCIYRILKSLRLNSPVKFFLKKATRAEPRKLFLLLSNWDRKMFPYPERRIDPRAVYDIEVERKIYEMSAKPYIDQYLSKFAQYDLGGFFAYMSLSLCPEMFFYPTFEMQNCILAQPVSPYWSDEMVKLAIRIPVQFKIKRGQTKYILRKAAFLCNRSNYWFLPKIGLQDSFSFINSTPVGRTWIRNLEDEMSRSEILGDLREALHTRDIDTSRLINFHLWKKANNF